MIIENVKDYFVRGKYLEINRTSIYFFMKKYFKTVYDLIPLKSVFFRLIKSLFSLHSSIYKHLHFKGAFKVKIDDEHSFIMYHHGGIEENEIFWSGLKGGWEKKSIAIWIKLVQNKKMIFDIGANTGVYALIARSMAPNSVVHAFEPIPGVFKLLSKNNDLNGYNINNHEIALSDFNGTAKIYLPENTDFAYSVTVNKNRLGVNRKVKELTVQTRTLSKFIEDNKIEEVDLMKIDVETHEAEVLNGMGEYLFKFQPTMLLEVLDENIAQKLNEIFKNMDYLYFNIDDQKNSIRQISKIEKSDYWNLLVCSRDTAKELDLI